ncbi:hypothetical protein C8N24_3687 [Solirubrobacter pauli]|uniref:Uncharacterized protein n=1 Tax=Solirubrobacter pauli TaxID=166793 RepID=A0A660LII9_9ACTN|nr:hypothetical protein C8N24_3687 [Solirubrobacter pauli]
MGPGGIRGDGTRIVFPDSHSIHLHRGQVLSVLEAAQIDTSALHAADFIQSMRILGERGVLVEVGVDPAQRERERAEREERAKPAEPGKWLRGVRKHVDERRAAHPGYHCAA